MSASQVLVELEEYASASNGMPDPSLEAVGLIPVIGALKNVDEVAALVKAFRQGENLLGNLGDSARAGSRLALAGAGAAENAGTLNRVSESFDAAADTARGGQRLAKEGKTAEDLGDSATRIGERSNAWTETLETDRIGTVEDEIANALLPSLVQHPDRLASYTPSSLLSELKTEGWEIQPLRRGSLRNIPFEEGGGYKVNFEDGGLFQYHPAEGSHHGGAYYKISTGKGGTKWYELDGMEKMGR